MNDTFELSCPVPYSDYDKVLLAHGGGGSLSNKLIQNLFQKYFSNPYLDQEHDGAILELDGRKLAFSTDSFVIDPVFFPGGNIGELAVYGTVNDLACCGATPWVLSLGLILEEGFPIKDLEVITSSIQQACNRAGVKIVTGDTKVVGKGKADRIFINTSGIGLVQATTHISPVNASDGDAILLSGTLADHGMAVMAVRNGLEFQTQLKSDTAPLNKMIHSLLQACPSVHVLRDPTRGGLASALNEIAVKARKGMILLEEKIPVKDEVKGLCEVLGLDPLYVANEGKIIVILPEHEAQKALSLMREFPEGKDTVRIGTVVSDHPGMVRMKTSFGTHRVVDMISGEQLPRIC